MNTPLPPDIPLLNKRYQIAKRIGSGGMSTVYRARDLTLERNVAIKLLREEFSSDEPFRQRFHQEAKAAASLAHSNIVTVHDFGLDQGRLYIIMEYVPGADLKKLLQQRGRFTVDEALPLLIQACAGLGFAHRAGLIHCDVKPHNLIVTNDNRLKVTDFGIARALASSASAEKSNVVWGSPQYFSPEQAAGYPPSPASDVYSLGVILYELLTGRLPFLADSAKELARLHREVTPKPPRQYNPAIPPALDEIILKTLDKEPVARYRTADQLGRVLMVSNQPEKNKNIQQAKPTAQQSFSPIQRSEKQNPLKKKPVSDISSRTVTGSLEKTSTPMQSSHKFSGIDWITWGLLLLALLAMGGLIPLGLWVFMVYTR